MQDIVNGKGNGSHVANIELRITGHREEIEVYMKILGKKVVACPMRD